jgi:type IX secretion system substrate protein
MKQPLFTLLLLFGVYMMAGGQVINISPQSLQFTATGSMPSAPHTVTITASGLNPASGNITISLDPKFMVSSDGTTFNYGYNIPYSGGTLPATTVYVEYTPPTPGYTASGAVEFLGGGATKYLCVCGNYTTCPCATTDVAALDDEPSITIAPNPVVNEMFINSTSKINTVAISNLIGKTVYAHNFNSEDVQVNVAALPGGIYIVRINDTEVRRFVKQ